MSAPGAAWLPWSAYDARIAKVVAELSAENCDGVPPECCSSVEPRLLPAPADCDYDWHARFAGVACQRIVPFVGPLDVSPLRDRGLGLVALRDIEAGELLLVEEAWVLSTETYGVGDPRAAEALVELCEARLLDLAVDAAEKELVSGLHGADFAGDVVSEAALEIRTLLFRSYLHRVQSRGGPATAPPSAAGGEAPSKSPSVPRALLRQIVALNARRTESWNARTLLLDEEDARGGLWLIASLFNHSCCGNVTLSYCSPGHEGAARVGALVARAAVALRAGTELCHTYVYPFDTVVERRTKLERGYGFSCACLRCRVEEPLAQEASTLADSLEVSVAAYSAARKAGSVAKMAAAMPDFQKALGRVDAVASSVRGNEEVRTLWRSQFVWGFHGLAMAAECAGQFEVAAEAFGSCARLIAAGAPSTGYDVKYRMMLAQCLARQLLSTSRPNDTASAAVAVRLREAMKDAEAAHNRCYGGGARHFLVRLQPRLDEIYAALRRASSAKSDAGGGAGGGKR